jgi:hypothetical protein
VRDQPFRRSADGKPGLVGSLDGSRTMPWASGCGAPPTIVPLRSLCSRGQPRAARGGRRGHRVTAVPQASLELHRRKAHDACRIGPAPMNVCGTPLGPKANRPGVNPRARRRRRSVRVVVITRSSMNRCGSLARTISVPPLVSSPLTRPAPTLGFELQLSEAFQVGDPMVRGDVERRAQRTHPDSLFPSRRSPAVRLPCPSRFFRYRNFPHPPESGSRSGGR